jgi:excinuclease ABC subunit C
MVVFKNGRPDRQGYRLFKVKTVEGQDDYASMREVLRRRFAHGDENDFAKIPDLVLMDGGRAHVFLARSVIEEFGLGDRIRVAGMVKDSRHRTAGLVRTDGSTLDLTHDRDMTDEKLVLLRLLTAIQNEVHRFAISYQRKLSQKRNLSFKLETIPGIGPAKRKALLKHFGTIGKTMKAEASELAKAPQISEANANAVYEHFHRGEN